MKDYMAISSGGNIKMSILELAKVGKRFGGLQVLSDVSFAVEEGKITSVIGPNGAGKTTLFNVISGFYRPDSGSIRFENSDISGWQPHRITRAGLARSFQITNIFPRLTVIENVTLAAQTVSKKRWTIFARAQKLGDVEEHAYEVLERIGLTSAAKTVAGQLSHGDQRHLEIAMALATKPRLMLLDEPTSGMSLFESNVTMELIRSLRGEVTILLIEHHMDLVMNLSDTIVVLNFGQKIADGSPGIVEDDPEVQRVYLGVGA
jgi:branched-chain amino acid transport system ATP-binding protein